MEPANSGDQTKMLEACEQKLSEGNLIESKPEALQYLDKRILSTRQYLLGDQPSASDNQLFESIKQHNLAKLVEPDSSKDEYNRLASWNILIGEFSNMHRLAWPDYKQLQFKEGVKRDKNTAEKDAHFKKVELVLKSIVAESVQEQEARLEKQRFENYIPPSERRPADEYFDLATLPIDSIGEAADIKMEGEKGTFLKYTMKPKTTRFDRLVESQDVVYHTCETRFSNGQLVDFNEKRKAKQKFEMGNQAFVEHKRRAFATMAVGEVAWFALSDDFTGGLYKLGITGKHDRKNIGELVYIKLFVESIKRQPIYKDKNTFAGRKDYFELCRDLCKELISENEYVNAQAIYQKVLGEFKAMPRKIKEAMTEEEKVAAEEIKFVLNCNLSLCHQKRNQALDAIKHAKEAVAIKEDSSKAHFRLYKAHRLNNDLDKAKESIKNALNLDPNNREIRNDYTELCNLKNKKEKEWYSKMSGFLDSDKMKRIEKKEEQERLLTHKIKRKHYGRQDIQMQEETSEKDSESLAQVPVETDATTEN